MHRSHRTGIVCVALALFLGGCYGPFNLTRRLYHWNTQAGGKWEQEIMFLLLAATPVYSFAALADAVVFNAMEFWTGTNPVDPPRAWNDTQPTQRRLVRGEDEVLLSRVDTPDSRGMTIEFFRNGQLQQTLHVKHRAGRPTIATDAQGRVLMSAQTLPDGSIVISDGRGQQVASYPADQVQRLVQSVQ